MPPTHGELVYTMTPDLVRLHGLYASSPQRLESGVDCGYAEAAILIHGLGGNFYSSRLLLHCNHMLQRLGMATVIVNTRGHDMINTSTWSGRARSVGAALENVGDAVHDIQGWVNFLQERDHRNILLFGHSLGAIKSLYAQAHGPIEGVTGIVGLSATRLSHQQMTSSPRGKLFRDTILRCQNLIAAGEGENPIHVPFPFPTWMTPDCYLEKYGPDEKYNWQRFIDKINVPTLLTFGSRELDENPAFDGLRETLTELDEGINSISVHEVAQADHFYTAKFDVLESKLTDWLT